MESFRAFRVHEESGKVTGRVENIDLDALSEGDVVIRGIWSDVNYKDALAATGKGKIMRRFPMVGGIDVAGYVHASSDARYQEGDAVLVTGFGLSEVHDGGYAEYTRVPADWVVPLPDGLSLYESMALGTAGFTAALAVDRMEHNGQAPEKGPILVNGATGGVGSFAIDVFAGLGYRVTAFTGKRDQDAYLKMLGASEILYRGDTELGTGPLGKALWAGAVDNVGGDELAWITSTVKPEGNIASIGLAGGFKLNTTVMPFILRGVSLLGINSVFVSPERRLKIWQRLGGDLKPRHLEKIVTGVVDLDSLPDVFAGYIEGRVAGRTMVKIAEA
jgi:NADPH2:quinone reductase